MTKLALVAMTMLFSTVAIADEFKIKFKDDQQIIQIRDDQYQWMLDVDCNRRLKETEETDISVSKKRVTIGKKIKVKQGKKESTCEIKQLAITSIW